jgi:adenylate cyclase class 2
MAKEIETKFRVEDPDSLRPNLAGIGARLLYRELEKDVYYAGPAREDITAVRLRSTHNKGLFTIKSMPDAKPGAPSGLKVLEELQVEVGDPGVFARILESMGYVPQFRKEKIREAYDWRGILICLDELPYLGFFLEVEAPEDGIRAAASALGLDMAKAMGETYMQIFTKYKTLRGNPELELVFP